ncbi:hypothetical protein L9F63_002763, partial [Diploptera punctata]
MRRALKCQNDITTYFCQVAAQCLQHIPSPQQTETKLIVCFCIDRKLCLSFVIKIIKTNCLLVCFRFFHILNSNINLIFCIDRKFKVLASIINKAPSVHPSPLRNGSRILEMEAMFDGDNLAPYLIDKILIFFFSKTNCLL